MCKRRFRHPHSNTPCSMRLAPCKGSLNHTVFSMRENQIGLRMETKRLKREIIEWGLLILVPLTLYLTGLHTPVLGYL